MTFNQNGAFINSTAFGNNQINPLFSLSSGNYLTHLILEGISNAPAAQFNIAVGQFMTDSIVGGVQYGPSGYGGRSLTGGNTAGASWLTWGNVTKGRAQLEYLAGTAPLAVVAEDSRIVSIEWHGLFHMTAATDFYAAFGTNPGQTFNFGVNYRWFAEWAS